MAECGLNKMLAADISALVKAAGQYWLCFYGRDRSTDWFTTYSQPNREVYGEAIAPAGPR